MYQLSPFLFYICIGCIGSISAYLAARQGRNPYLWFFIGFFFGLVGLVTIFFVPKIQKEKKGEARTPVTESFIVGPTDKFWYYLDPAHKQMGPLSFTALNRAWKEGKVKSTTFVWNEEFSEWKPLQDCLQTRTIRSS